MEKEWSGPLYLRLKVVVLLLKEFLVEVKSCHFFRQGVAFEGRKSRSRVSLVIVFIVILYIVHDCSYPAAFTIIRLCRLLIEKILLCLTGCLSSPWRISSFVPKYLGDIYQNEKEKEKRKKKEKEKSAKREKRREIDK